jgi:hypothetical protein
MSRARLHFSAGPNGTGPRPVRCLPSARRPRPASRWTADSRPGLPNTHPAARIPSISALGIPLSRVLSTTLPRRCTSSSGMSIRTGQTSKQRPHRDDAYGSDFSTGPASTPLSSGLRTAPIGPG